jgi:hypothetical protein
MPANITGSRYINSTKHTIVLNSLSKRILSVHLIANPTMHENVYGEGHELTVSIIANTNVFHNVSKHRKTIEEIIHIHKTKISLLTRKIPAFYQYKNTFLIQSYISGTIFDYFDFALISSILLIRCFTSSLITSSER